MTETFAKTDFFKISIYTFASNKLFSKPRPAFGFSNSNPNFFFSTRTRTYTHTGFCRQVQAVGITPKLPDRSCPLLSLIEEDQSARPLKLHIFKNSTEQKSKSFCLKNCEKGGLKWIYTSRQSFHVSSIDELK